LTRRNIFEDLNPALTCRLRQPNDARVVTFHFRLSSLFGALVPPVSTGSNTGWGTALQLII
jgi:hypothetical protein